MSKPADGPVDFRIWTTRQRLTFPLTHPEMSYSLPLYLHLLDLASVIITDSEGKELTISADTLYEALDNKLFWLRHEPGTEVFFFGVPEISSEGDGDTAVLRLSAHGAVLPLAEYFNCEKEELLEKWQMHAEKVTAAQRINLVSVESKEEYGKFGWPSRIPEQALELDTAAGFISLVHTPPVLSDAAGSRIHLRVFFWDHGEDNMYLGHWFGIKSPLGSASLGLAFGIEGSYSFLNGHVAGCEPGGAKAWLRVADRSPGWHLLELTLDDDQVHAAVDNEPVISAKAEGHCETEEIWIASRSGGDGVWAGLELFHTPLGNRTWESGVQALQPGDRLPWKVLLEEGRWQMDCDGVMQSVDFGIGAIATITSVKQRLLDSFSRAPPGYDYKPGMDQMLGKQYRVLKLSEDGMVGLPSPDGSDDGIWWFPPSANALTVQETLETAAPEPTEEATVAEAVPEVEPAEAEEEAEAETMDPEEAKDVGPGPVSVGGLLIDCWNIPGEEDLKRIERVMNAYVNALQQADLPLPENIARVQQCGAHPSCHVYKFGTRRVHMATRAGEGGRLLLVVRVGGGYMDFVEYARRHGSLEQLRLKKTEGDREVIRLTSVLSQGKRKEILSGRSSRPPSRAGSRHPTPRRMSKTTQA